MSWIVETLLRDREKIRSDHDITNDEFLDLMLIESAINELSRKGLLTESEVVIINEVGDGSSLADIGKRVNLSGDTVARRMKRVCDLVAYKLGGEFTNEGYLDRLNKLYDVDAEQLGVLASFMQSKYKRTIPRHIRGEQKNEM